MGVSLWQRLASQYAVLYNFLLNLKTQLESNSGGGSWLLIMNWLCESLGAAFLFNIDLGNLLVYIYIFILLFIYALV